MLRVCRLGLAASFLVTTLGCGGDDSLVGQGCVAESEYSVSVGGYSPDQVTVEVGSPSCGGETCLINKFQGRVTCPYGANRSDVQHFAELLDTDPAAALAYAQTPDPETGQLPRICLVPRADGTQTDDYVLEEVRPQIESRPPSDAVYCSCRCAGPADASDPAGGRAQYCECGTGFSCLPLIDDLGFDDSASGSYCVRDGTSDVGTGAICDASRGNCEGR